MLTMTTKQFRSMLREAGVDVWQCYTNPSVKESARTVGAMLTESNVHNELQKFVDVMTKYGHDPKAHNIRITDSGRCYYIRGVAAYQE